MPYRNMAYCVTSHNVQSWPILNKCEDPHATQLLYRRCKDLEKKLEQ